MKSAFITICFVLSTLLFHAQTKKSKIYLFPAFSVEYTRQKTNNFSGSAGVWNHKNFFAGAGLQFYKSNHVLYVAPSLQVERSFLISKSYKYGYTGPLLRLNFSSHKINGLRDNYLSADIGIRVFWYSIFVGYNYCLDKKELNQIAPIRFGIKCW